MESPLSWQPELDQLAKLSALAREHGGAEKVARHKAAGKLTARERIDGLLDGGSFHEIGGIAGSARYDTSETEVTGFTPANLVIGRGAVEQRPVVVAADDFTVRGGANDGAVKEKLIYVEAMANELCLPLIRLVDGTGGGGSVKNIENEGATHVPNNGGRLWDLVCRNLSTIPVVGLALGSTAGLGAARVCSSHYSMMVRGTSQLFAAGPPLVARVGQVVTKEELGGSEIHARNGVVDDEVESEGEAFLRTRRFLSYLPSSVHEFPPRAAPIVDTARSDEWLLAAIPRDDRKVYKIRPILETLFDAGSFMEIGRLWGKSIVTGFARLDGWAVAVMASDPYVYGGAWSADTAQKIVRFVDLAETFHLPVVFLVDIPGFAIGVDSERAGTIRHGVRALAAIHQARVPWCSVILRKAFGIAGAAHMNGGRFNFRYAWPSGQWGSLPLAGGLEVAYKSEIESASDPVAKLREIQERLSRLRSPIRSAERFFIEEIIDPRQTRSVLCEFAALAAPLRVAGTPSFGTRP